MTTFNPRSHLKNIRRRNPYLAKGRGQIATPLSIPTSGGKQKFNCTTIDHPITFTPLG